MTITLHKKLFVTPYKKWLLQKETNQLLEHQPKIGISIIWSNTRMVVEIEDMIISLIIKNISSEPDKYYDQQIVDYVN